MLGAWAAAALFTLAHWKTARFARARARQFAYLVQVFLTGLLLAAVFEFRGLLPVIALHAAIDAVALMSLWLLSRVKAG